MDYAACNVVYVDSTAGEDRLVKRSEISQSLDSKAGDQPDASSPFSNDTGRLRVNDDLETLLGTFSEGETEFRIQSLGEVANVHIVHVCSTGKACILKLNELHDASIIDLIPTLVLINIPYNDSFEEQRTVRTPSPTSTRQVGDTLDANEAEDNFYGLSLLQWISADIQQNNISKLVVPVAVVAIPEGMGQWPLAASVGPANPPLDQKRTMRYLDVGAIDVLTTPLIIERLPSLAIHAYRAHKDSMKDQKALMEMKRGRKRSWVGLDDQKPYAYLREAMVSGLMDGICRLGGEEEESPLTHARIVVTDERKAKIVESVSSWAFSAHDFSDDELLYSAVLMLQHALTMPELDQWRMPTGESEFLALFVSEVLQPVYTQCMLLAGELTYQTNREYHWLFDSMSCGIQCLRAIPQLQTCCRRASSLLPLPCQKWHLATVSNWIRCSRRRHEIRVGNSAATV